jgi:hypothetical protein
MNDHFDTLITESLHREASALTGRGAGFGDVRRRARRRQQRNVAAMAVPAVLGAAALTMRQSPQPEGVQPVGGSTASTTGVSSTSGNVPESTSRPSPATSGPTASTIEMVTPSGDPTPTTVVGVITTPSEFATTIPDNVIGSVVCLNASGDPTFAFVRGCQISVGGGKWLTAGKVSTTSFVMALNPVAKDRADRVGAMLGLKVRTLDTSYLPDSIDLANSGADVVVVMSPAGTPSTTTTTIVPHP